MTSQPLESGRPTKRLVRRLVLVIGVSLILFVGASWLFAFKLTGPRHRPVGPPPSDFPFLVEEVSWTASDSETIKGWFVPAEKGDRAIILLHGYAGDRRSMLPRAKFFRAAGYAVLLYDARACGESTGEKVTFGYHESRDLAAGVDWLRRRGYRNLACLGVSQGAATILMSAEQLHDIRCVICESAFDELGHAVENRFRHYVLAPGWLAGCLMIPLAESRTGISVDDVKPIDHLTKLRCPLFIIGGEEDVKTLPSETRRLFDAAPAPKELWMVPGAGHRDLFQHEGYADRVSAFLARHMN